MLTHTGNLKQLMTPLPFDLNVSPPESREDQAAGESFNTSNAELKINKPFSREIVCAIPSSNGGISLPTRRKRGNKSGTSKKAKEEVANDEEITKIGSAVLLLHECNPGIICRVRNREEVYSRIRATIGLHGHGKECKEKAANYDSHGEEGGSIVKDKLPDRNRYLRSSAVGQEDELVVKCSTEESSDTSSLLEQSKGCASISSTWLKFLIDDTERRLTALKISKDRVRGVISTGLPHLISKNFGSDQENNPCVLSTRHGLSTSAAAASLHDKTWRARFDQLDRTLSDEEKKLLDLLSRLLELKRDLDSRLQHFNQSSAELELFERLRPEDSLKMEHAVIAAAGALYSTCNYLNAETKES